MNSAPPSETTVVTFCACCDEMIHIHLGPKVEFHDLLQGHPFDSAALPQVEDARLLVCLWCLDDAKKVVDAGLTFVSQAFRDAKRAAREELRADDPFPALLREFLKTRSYDSAEFAEFMHERLGTKPTPEEDRAKQNAELSAYEDAVLLEHYQRALARHLSQMTKQAEQQGYPARVSYGFPEGKVQRDTD